MTAPKPSPVARVAHRQFQQHRPESQHRLPGQQRPEMTPALPVPRPTTDSPATLALPVPRPTADSPATLALPVPRPTAGNPATLALQAIPLRRTGRRVWSGWDAASIACRPVGTVVTVAPLT